MAEVDNIDKAKILFIYTEIGRGHPSYIDGIIFCLERDYPELPFYKTNVFTITKGLSNIAWRFIRFLYRWGSQGGMVSFFYTRLRRILGANQSGSFLAGLLGMDIKRFSKSYTGKIVVGHPLLARILAGQNDVLYQHGELVVPSEAIVRNCDIFVPTESSAEKFKESGIENNRIVVTAQCLEPELIAKIRESFDQRIKRLSGRGTVTAALFTTGAYPADHLRQLYIAARAFSESGNRVYFFTGQDLNRHRLIVKHFRNLGINYGTRIDGNANLKVIGSQSRYEENLMVAKVFDRFDFFVAAAHERINWSIGAGLPQLILRPHIGSFAPLNAELAVNQGSAVEVEYLNTPAELLKLVEKMKNSGRLSKMAHNGYHPDNILGFSGAAAYLNRITSNQTAG